MQNKKTIAVFFGGRSPEHDISVITGLQVLQAIDVTRYDAFPVYIAIDGSWLIGEPLRKRENYLPNTAKLTKVNLDLNSQNKGRLLPAKQKLFGKTKPIEFDVALLAFHGLIGEDGQIQGVLETANIPYTGMRAIASAIAMDKVATKHILAATNIPLLPYHIITKPKEGLLLTPEGLSGVTRDMKFPCCLKPCHLGSSIGIAKVTNPEELNAVLPRVFKYDTAAIVEPFVENLVEYNVAVRRYNGEIVTSAIERPKCSEELLDFKHKYMTGSKNKIGTKTPTASSQGMLSLTRELNPALDSKLQKNIHTWAKQAFAIINGAGIPRIDFLYNQKTKQIWFNEINPIPGSFGYFLWEATEQSVLFTQLLNDLIKEALDLHSNKQIPNDPVPEEARLLPRGSRS